MTGEQVEILHLSVPNAEEIGLLKQNADQVSKMAVLFFFFFSVFSFKR